MRRERSAPRMTTNVTASRATKSPSRIAVDPGPLSPEKNSESRITAPKSAIDAAARTSCPNRLVSSPTSLSTGMITPSEVPQRMIATSSGVSTRPAALSPKRGDDRDRERDRPSDRRQPQQPPSQAVEIDLEPGEEEQEGESEQGEDLDRLVELDPAEHGRADHDPGDDLEDDRGQPQPRGEAEQERRRECDRHDHQQPAEAGLLHHALADLVGTRVTFACPTRCGMRYARAGGLPVGGPIC